MDGERDRIPAEVDVSHYLSDTVDYAYNDRSAKILVYVDSAGCTSCKIQLELWKDFMEQVRLAGVKGIPFLFVFQTNEEEEIEDLLRTNYFSDPVCFDREDQWNLLNRFPEDDRFHTFLLDENNKVVLLGDPTRSILLKDMYLKQLTGNDKEGVQVARTSVRIENRDIHLGDFSKGESKEALFELVYTGDQPLVILDMATSCGCAHPEYDKRPVPKGGKAQIKVVMTPTDMGFFSETVTVRCNTDTAIRLTMCGMVK